MTTKTAAQIVSAAAAYRLALSEGPVEELGVGFAPGEEEAAVRRAAYAKTAVYFDGPMARKAQRATTKAKLRRLAHACHRHCSATSERIWNLAVSL